MFLSSNAVVIIAPTTPSPASVFPFLRRHSAASCSPRHNGWPNRSQDKPPDACLRYVRPSNSFVTATTHSGSHPNFLMLVGVILFSDNREVANIEACFV